MLFRSPTNVAALMAGAAAPFDPSSVSPIVWLDPSDLSTLWQDTAGTTAVTTDGQSVARIDNKGSAGGYAGQSTSGQRPLYKTNGTLHWLLFDGTDDALQVASVQLPSYMYLCLGLDMDANGGMLVEHSANAGSNDGFWFYSTQFESWRFRRSATDHAANGVANWPGTSAAVTELIYSGTGTYNLNGSAQANNTESGSDIGSSNTTAALNIFSRNQASLYVNGKMHGLIVTPSSISSGDQTSTRQWMATKSGVTL